MGIYSNGKNCSEKNKYVSRQEIVSTVPQYETSTHSAGYELGNINRLRMYPNSTSEIYRTMKYTIFTNNFVYYENLETFERTPKTITTADLFELEDLKIVFGVGLGRNMDYYEKPFSQVASWLQYTKSLDENNHFVLTFKFIADPPELTSENDDLFFLGFLTKLKYDGAYCITVAEDTTQSPISSKIAKCQYDSTNFGDWSRSEYTLRNAAQETKCSTLTKTIILENSFNSGDEVPDYLSQVETDLGYYVWFYKITTPPSSATSNPTGTSAGISSYIHLTVYKNAGELYEH